MYEYTLLNTITNEETISFGRSCDEVLKRNPNCVVICREYID